MTRQHQGIALETPLEGRPRAVDPATAIWHGTVLGMVPQPHEHGQKTAGTVALVTSTRKQAGAQIITNLIKVEQRSRRTGRQSHLVLS